MVRAAGLVCLHSLSTGPQIVDPRRSKPTLGSALEVSTHLIDQQVALAPFKFVEDHESLLVRRLLVEEVEEPFEEIRVVLAKEVAP